LFVLPGCEDAQVACQRFPFDMLLPNSHPAKVLSPVHTERVKCPIKLMLKIISIHSDSVDARQLGVNGALEINRSSFQMNHINKELTASL